MINLQILETFEEKVSPNLLEKAALAVLKHEEQPEAVELTIVITDDAEIRYLNQQFREVDAPTDVLSFPADEIDPDTGNTYLGDIIISYPRVLRQSEAGGHAPEHELELLVVHGTLHLLGYDHAEPDEKEAMWAAQAGILAGLGNPLQNPG